MEETYILEMRDIEKSYSGNKVLKGVSFHVKPGEIFSIVGENGAGKSTLMNILFGMPVIRNTGGYGGRILFDSKEIKIESPLDAMRLRIGMVHQEFMLIPQFSITENIKLNRENTRPNAFSRVFGWQFESLDMMTMASDARKALDVMGLEIPESEKIEGMPVGYMQFIECAREVDKQNVRLIVFDEPTAVLTESESSKLLEAIKHIASQGVGIIFIGHKLNEVLDVSDEIMVMRDGEMVTVLPRAEASEARLAELMVGRKINVNVIAKKRNLSANPILLDVHDLRVMMSGELVKGVDFKVHKGEILGIAGLAGYGKIGIANGIIGLYPTTGSIVYKGELLPLNNPLAARKKGIAFVSEDRKGIGLLLTSSIEQNIVTPALFIKHEYLKKTGPFHLLDKKAVRAQAELMIKQISIKCSGPTQKVGRLSGGNQQKVCIASSLTTKPELLLVSEPTRGIDIGAKQVILGILKELCMKEGMTLIVTSSELNELRMLCDRILIITNGKVAGQLYPDSSDADFGLLMSGSEVRTGGEQ